MSERDEYVDVVSPIADTWAVIALICFGMMLGFVGGLGYSYFDMLDATQAKIVGNVRVYPGPSGTIKMSGMTILDADIGISIVDCDSEE